MCPTASNGPGIPMRVREYVDAIVNPCADGGRGLVSVVLFGSVATGGWVEPVSDVDLILFVPEFTPMEARDGLSCEVERIEKLHGLRSELARGTSALEKLLNRLIAHDRSFFICTRSDLQSG